MSPRRRVDAQERDYFDFAVEPREPRSRPLMIWSTVAGLLLVAAVTAASLMLVSYESDRRADQRNAEALYYVRGFMTMYTTLDPFNANAYADRVLAQGTGEFATMFKQKQNEILIQVARAEPTEGSVVEAGVQRWNDNGSADVLVATKTTSKTPDGKSTIESGNRWVATAMKEGQQWKISQLIQVI
ncbi:mammalian cell entry protein [Mycolicibacterium sp. S2-37]|uniref:mammalian cell entry protein n=1 Tax=Mycolicibacterium sp. S2-37 TaxID=2810297 RepID=UPI001A9423DE|nr:mammalian cell entry protein [Mycolicibacterium sp. S2-37]MBO0678559.1 mammalian cell entry protein [Mycolicibacterium sp. S2-37]